ncbi:MAG: hypothetical protein JSV69_03815 [Chloroflexota bacterium]|nr:MAG: hypothetical protein JSV69_03815 [Chloroflexota bacterium]
MNADSILYDSSSKAKTMMDIYNYWVAGNDVTIRFESGSATGTQIYSASCKFTSVEITAQAEENVTFSFTANSNGSISKTVVS